MAKTNQTPIALLIATDEFVANQRKIDPKLGNFANAEAAKAQANGRLAEWLAEMTA